MLSVRLVLAGVALALSVAGPAHAAFPGVNGRFAFARAPSLQSGPRLFQMNAAGGGQVPFTAGVDRSPAWSPDGRKIAFVRQGARSDTNVYVIDAGGGGLTPLTSDTATDSEPAWSPDGRKIAFTSSRGGDTEVMVMNADGSAEAPLTSSPTADGAPSWSPDGSKIAFASDRDGTGNFEIYVMNADGSAETRLPLGSTTAETEPDWSPDGGRIAYTLTPAGGPSDVWLMNANGSGRIPLTSSTAIDRSPAWSPDAARIAFSSRRSNVEDIYVMNANGSAQAPLTTTADVDTEPSWQPIPPVMSIGDLRIGEGDRGRTSAGLRVSLSGPLFAPARVSFATVPSRARAPLDYAAGGGLLTFAPGVTAATAGAAVIGDPIDEPNESFLVRLSGPAGGVLGDATGRITIVDDDPPPVLGRSFDLEPLAGRVFISLPRGAARTAASVPGLKGRRFVPLKQARRVPIGSLLDTRRGRVRITTARDRRGRLQSGQFAAGVFQVLQSRRRRARGLTELRLKGASFKRCATRRGKRAQAAGRKRRLSKRAIRRLRSKATGRFRTRGRHSSATVRGTSWTITDRCDGTLTKVTRGRVDVRDFRRKKTIRLRRGKSYLARARR